MLIYNASDVNMFQEKDILYILFCNHEDVAKFDMWSVLHMSLGSWALFVNPVECI